MPNKYLTKIAEFLEVPLPEELQPMVIRAVNQLTRGTPLEGAPKQGVTKFVRMELRE